MTASIKTIQNRTMVISLNQYMKETKGIERDQRADTKVGRNSMVFHRVFIINPVAAVVLS